MKKQISWTIGLGVMVLSLAGGGCLKSSAPEGAAPVADSQADPAWAFHPVPDDEAEAMIDDAEGSDVSEAEVSIVSAEDPPPSKINPTGPLSEVIRLTESGVDEAVILAYVTNSATSFQLAPDEIIYLSDIGVPTVVVMAMLERDGALKQGPAQANVIADEARETPLSGAGSPGSPEFVALPAPTVPVDSMADNPPQVPSAGEEDPSGGFHDALAPYGTWVDVGGYGRCWQPAVEVGNPNWRPYYDRGHWISTECGWYWLSDYSWGWAPFHYGRWFRHSQLGWCWTPDQVWGPSWVTWRYGSEYCGWAPLPPRSRFIPGFGFTFEGHRVAANFGFRLGPTAFAFVRFQDFQEHRLAQFAVSRDRVAQAFETSVPVTRFVSEHDRVVNSGLTPQLVAAVTHREIHPVTIREVSTLVPRVGGTRAERLDPASGTLSVYRPHLRVPASLSDPVPAITQVATSPVPAPANNAPRSQRPRSFTDVANQDSPSANPRPAEIGSPPVGSAIPTSHASIAGRAEPRSPSTVPNHITDRSERQIQAISDARSVESKPDGQKYPPHSLVVIGRKDPGAREPNNQAGVRPWQVTQAPPPQVPAESPMAVSRPNSAVSPVAQAPVPVPRATSPQPGPERPASRPVVSGADYQRPAAYEPPRATVIEPPHPIPAAVPAPEHPRSAPVESAAQRPSHEAPPAPSAASSAHSSPSSPDRDSHQRR